MPAVKLPFVEQIVKRRYYAKPIIKKSLGNMPLKKQFKSIFYQYNVILRFDSGEYDTF
jgi:hypothetical protein